MNILPLISSSISGSSDDEGSSCPSLSLTQRLTAFGICTGLGKQTPFTSKFSYFLISQQVFDILTFIDRLVDISYELCFHNGCCWWCSIQVRALLYDRQCHHNSRVVKQLLLLRGFFYIQLCLPALVFWSDSQNNSRRWWKWTGEWHLLCTLVQSSQPSSSHTLQKAQF